MPCEPRERPRTEVVVDAAIGERLRRKLTLVHSEIGGRDLDRRKEPRKRRRGTDHLRDARRLAGDVSERIHFARLALLDVEAVSVEHRHHAIADVRREHVQGRLLGQFKEPPVAVEELAIGPLQERIGGELRRMPAGELGGQSQRKEQGQPADDPVADVVLHEVHDLRGRLAKRPVIAGVAVPVEDEVGPHDASAGDGGDVGDERQGAVVTEVADHAQVIERGSKPSA